MTIVTLPANDWKPRPYQEKAWAALENGCTRFALAWHRRAGKDEFALHAAACAAFERVGCIWHMLPMASQARKAIWNGVNPITGRRRIDDAFPKSLRDKTVDDEMFIRFKNGSTWQVVGSDNFNSLVGSPPVGVVFSEYALANPSAWAFIRPILIENGGWAMFISTPRGRNHFAKLVEYAMQKDNDWFGQILTVQDTGAMSEEMLATERRELTVERGAKEAQAIISQEYFCDFDAAIPGAYYGELMKNAEREGRIGVFPHLPNLPVGTAWDLGRKDSTVVFFFQQLPNGRVRIIDVLEGSGVGIDWYAQKILQKPYTYADHIWPHDGGHGNIRDIGSTSLVSNAANLLGRKPRVLDRDPTTQMGINAVRQMLPLCEFNTEPRLFQDESMDDAQARMNRALDALRSYHRKWDEKLQRFSDEAEHDWASHTADALRYLARGRKPFRDESSLVSYKADNQYDMYRDGSWR